jgi:hypothetical protein
MPLLFSYGTLRDAAVQLRVFGRRINGTPDEILGFTRRSIDISSPDFAAADGSRQSIVRFTGRDEDRTPGTVFELTDAELATVDAYEPAEYSRVRARFASGREGWVYAEASADTKYGAPKF